MPHGMPMLSANDHSHWRERARLVSQIRTTAGWCARRQRIPRLERVTVTALWWPPNQSRHRDPDNLAPTVKACIDGLRDAGVLPGDDRRHVVAVTLMIAEQTRINGQLALYVKDVADAAVESEISAIPGAGSR